MSGASTVEDAQHLREQLCQLLNLAGMKLRKWMSSSNEFRKTIPSDLIETEDLLLPASDNAPKALGMHWDVSIHTLNSSPVIFKSLHGFADASNMVYGAVVYLRQVHEDTSVSISLVLSKARVAPLNVLTTLRAELVAAYLLSKLLTYVSKLLDIPTYFAWTNSTIVLCWLRKLPSTLKTFVAHRVSAIQDLVPTSRWRHVPTQENPADLLSRCVPATKLTSLSIWWQCTPWLKSQPEQWPT